MLDGLLVGLFVTGYMARYVAPRLAWWSELIATALPYLSLMLLGATVLVAMKRRWKLLLLHLVLMGLAAVRFVPLERGARPQPDDLVLMTVNTSRGGGATAETLRREITALVRRVEPDLVAFQEAYVEYHPDGEAVRPEYLLKTLVDSLDYRTIGPRPNPGATYTPQPVLGRVELLDQTQLLLPTPGTPARDMRGVRTVFRWKGREAVHYNLHLHTFGSRKPWEDERRNAFSPSFWGSYIRQYREAYLKRSSEMEQLRELLGREALPLIVSGDFNSTPHNSVFHGLMEAGLQDAFKVAGTGWGATYHADWPLARIDHVLVGPAWKVVQAEVIDTGFSDHKALVVRLRWRGIERASGEASGSRETKAPKDNHVRIGREWRGSAPFRSPLSGVRRGVQSIRNGAGMVQKAGEVAGKQGSHEETLGP